MLLQRGLIEPVSLEVKHFANICSVVRRAAGHSSAGSACVSQVRSRLDYVSVQQIYSSLKTHLFPYTPLLAQLDEESDEELEVLSGMYAQEASDTGEDGTHRYSLLRELWSSAR